MKFIYGNPKIAMSIGVGLLGDKPTPFFGFVDRDKIKGKENFSEGADSCALMIAAIEEAGGVVIYVENPDAAERLTSHLLMTFASAIDTDWHDIEETGVGLQ